MAAGRKPTKKQLMAAIPLTGGVISLIATKLNVDWHTAKKYIDSEKADPEVAQAYRDECEAILDRAENKLHLAIENGDLLAIKYLLSTKGRRRGYVPLSAHLVGGPDWRELAKEAGFDPADIENKARLLAGSLADSAGDGRNLIAAPDDETAESE